MRIQFSVLGACTQTISLKPACPYTPQQIVDALNGEGGLSICTTVQEGGQLVLFGEDDRALGIVDFSEMDAEYNDFALLDE